MTPNAELWVLKERGDAKEHLVRVVWDSNGQNATITYTAKEWERRMTRGYLERNGRPVPVAWRRLGESGPLV